MTTTPRLDRSTAGGTGHRFARIRLADGHTLDLKIQPGADSADEVVLSPGLTAPDTGAREDEDRWELPLTGGACGEGSLFLDVPVPAVRDLIEQHGGEHQDQNTDSPAPDTEETDGPATPDLLTRLADLRGRFRDGYTPQDIRAVFGRIREAGGPYLVCLWDYADEDGFGGNSQFYAETQARFHEVSPNIYRWLSGAEETPGPVTTWVGPPVPGPFRFTASDDFHNYAQSGL